MVRVICILDHSSALRNNSIDRGISRLEDVVAGGLWQISRVVSANKDRRVRSLFSFWLQEQGGSEQGSQFETAEYVDKLWNTLPSMGHYEKFFGCGRVGEHVADG